MNKIFIHIGANKTASTTLQRALFSQSSQLHYLGEDGENYESHRDTLNSIVNDDDIHYQPNQAEQLFNTAIASSVGLNFIYSNEDIMTSRVPSLCAHRLHHLMPTAEIIMLIRNQNTAIPSWYANHGAFLRNVPSSHFHRYVAFDEWMNHCTTFINYSPLDGFFYYEIINLYASLFGKSKIHILMFEELTQNPDAFFKKLSNVLQIDYDTTLASVADKHERKRISQRQFRAHQNSKSLMGTLLNLLPAPLQQLRQNYLTGGEALIVPVTDEWLAKIYTLYGESNTKLSEEYKLSLADHKYPLIASK